MLPIETRVLRVASTPIEKRGERISVPMRIASPVLGVSVDDVELKGKNRGLCIMMCVHADGSWIVGSEPKRLVLLKLG